MRFNLVTTFPNNIFNFLNMKKDFFVKVWMVLIILTFSTALVSISTLIISNAALIILGLSIVKFLGVSFYFMELRKAHMFWKSAIFIYVFLFCIITIMLL